MGHSVDLFCETYAELLVEATREAAEMAGAFLAAHTAEPEEKPTVVPLRPGRRRNTMGT